MADRKIFTPSAYGLALAQIQQNFNFGALVSDDLAVDVTILVT